MTRRKRLAVVKQPFVLIPGLREGIRFLIHNFIFICIQTIVI